MLVDIDEFLTDDLLSTQFRELKEDMGKVPRTFGHCYVASEALYHLLFKEIGFKPYRARDEKGITHWWLESEDGYIIDPTASQYYDRGLCPPYENKKCGGFLTKGPSFRAKMLMLRIVLGVKR